MMATLIAWALEATGYDAQHVIASYADGPTPSLPYLLVDIIADVEVGEAFPLTPVADDVTGFLDVRIAQLHEASVTVDVFGAGDAVLKVLSKRLRSSREARIALSTSGVAIHSAGGPRRIPAYGDTRSIERHQIEFRALHFEYTDAAPDYCLESVDISGEFVGDDATILTQSVTTDLVEED